MDGHNRLRHYRPCNSSKENSYKNVKSDNGSVCKHVWKTSLWRTYNTCRRRPSRNIIISLKNLKSWKNVFPSLLSFLPLLQGVKFSQMCFENSSLSKNREKARSCNRWEQIHYKRLMGRQNPRNHYDELVYTCNTQSPAHILDWFSSGCPKWPYP